MIYKQDYKYVEPKCITCGESGHDICWTVRPWEWIDSEREEEVRLRNRGNLNAFYTHLYGRGFHDFTDLRNDQDLRYWRPVQLGVERAKAALWARRTNNKQLANYLS